MKGIIRAGTSGRPFWGYRVRGRSAKRGWGGGEGRAVSGFAFPGLRPAQALTTKNPAPGRGTLGKAGMVFVDGEGVPSPAPPQVISPRSGVWDDTGEGHNQGRHLGPAFLGLS